MNGLHNLVVTGKVLYLVRLALKPNVVGTQSHAQRLLGHFRHTGVGRSESEHIRSLHGEDAVLHIPGPLERHAARSRT